MTIISWRWYDFYTSYGESIDDDNDNDKYQWIIKDADDDAQCREMAIAFYINHDIVINDD